MASPAASSLAELILCPVDSRSIAWLIARSFFVSALAVIVAAVFVLIAVILYSSLASQVHTSPVNARFKRPFIFKKV
jgi:uncharacterized membrane protein